MLLFESEKVEIEFEQCSPVLRFVVDHFAMLSMQAGVIPKVLRVAQHKYELGHMENRAIDMLNEIGLGGTILYNANIAQKINGQMQERFPGIVCCMCSTQNYREKFSTRRAAMHFHIEIPRAWLENDRETIKQISRMNPQS